MINWLKKNFERNRAIYYLSRIFTKDSEWVLSFDTKGWERMKDAIRKGLYAKD